MYEVAPGTWFGTAAVAGGLRYQCLYHRQAVDRCHNTVFNSAPPLCCRLLLLSSTKSSLAQYFTEEGLLIRAIIDLKLE